MSTIPKGPNEPWGSQSPSQPFSTVIGSCSAEPKLYSLSLDAGDGGVEGCLDVRHGAGGYDQLLVCLELLTHVLPMQRARVKEPWGAMAVLASTSPCLPWSLCPLG